MDIFEFQKDLFQAGKKYGFSDMEIFYSSSKSTSVNVQNNSVRDYKIAETSGLSFRGIYNDKIGYSYAEKISKESIDFLLKEAMENAEVIELDDKEELFEGAERYNTVNEYSEALANTPVQRLIESAFEMEKCALRADSRIKQALACLVSKYTYEGAIINTRGLNCFSKGCFANAEIYVMAIDEGQASTGFYYDFTLNDFSKINIKEVAEKAVNEAVSKLGAKSIPSGNYPIILRYDVATDIFKTFISSISGENVEKGLSRMKEKLGEKVAGSIINVIEDPLMEGAPNASSYDAEGYPTRKIKLIEKGMLLSFMHNRKTAKKAGTRSTGNASKTGYRSILSVGPHNVYLKPGVESLDSIIRQTQNGIFVVEFQGTNAGINDVSGDFSLYAAGFLIEEGKLTHPVNQITISGNVFDLMNNLEAIANDLKIKGSVTSPSVKIKSLSIAGE